MQIPGEGKAFLDVKDLVEMGYGSERQIRCDIANDVIPCVRIQTSKGGPFRTKIPRDEFVALLESRHNGVTVDADAEAVVG